MSRHIFGMQMVLSMVPLLSVDQNDQNEVKHVSGLVGRALTEIVRGVGLSATWCYTFPWIRCLGILLYSPYFK